MLDVRQFFDLIGGTRVVEEVTGLKRARISQLRTANKLPSAWEKFFAEKFPEQYKQAKNGH